MKLTTNSTTDFSYTGQGVKCCGCRVVDVFQEVNFFFQEYVYNSTTSEPKSLTCKEKVGCRTGCKLRKKLTTLQPEVFLVDLT